MSDLNEEYQDQVLEDLSDIKESVTTDSGYEEKVLDDLDDIKESVSEEQEYYDKEYQKKVLGNLRTLQKSVEALDVDYTEISNISSGTVGYGILDDNSSYYRLQGYNVYCVCFNISDYNVVYLDLLEVYTSGAAIYKTKYFLCDYSPSQLSSTNSYLTLKQYNYVSSTLSKFQIYNSDNNQYLYIFSGFDPKAKLYYIESVNSEDVNSGSAVIAEGIDTLIQITTFQGFASALLTGILLFLVFVKGLRR